MQFRRAYSKGFQLVSGESLGEMNGIATFVYYSEVDRCWYVCAVMTGLSIGEGASKDEAIAEAKVVCRDRCRAIKAKIKLFKRLERRASNFLSLFDMLNEADCKNLRTEIEIAIFKQVRRKDVEK